MAIGLVMQFSGVGIKDYNDVMKLLELESPGVTGVKNDWPVGIISHVAGATENGWCVVDTWESQEKFDAFMQSHLGPALGKTGMPEPQVTPFEVYNSYP
ncbi:MAG TPA: hypothetical protein VMR97_04305 [Acidimicrobiales bacterium]|nr:hypothetical protein [Acidimicrobiales bacterium]